VAEIIETIWFNRKIQPEWKRKQNTRAAIHYLTDQRKHQQDKARLNTTRQELLVSSQLNAC
jgi:hypothetical protein